MSSQPAPRMFSTVFGLLMAASSAGPAAAAGGPALLAAALGAVGVIVGLAARPVATGAVVAAASALALSPPAPLFAALAGLSAAAYLVIRHATPSVVTTTRPTMLAAIGFTAAGLAAAAWPVSVPWLPLLAAPALAAVYLFAVRPYIGERVLTGPRRTGST